MDFEAEDLSLKQIVNVRNSLYHKVPKEQAKGRVLNIE